MTTRKYALTVVVMLLAVLFTNFGIFVAPVISSESLEQGRTACLITCDNPIGRTEMYFWGGGGGDNGLWRLRSICIANCEKKFWKEWQKEMDEIGKD